MKKIILIIIIALTITSCATKVTDSERNMINGVFDGSFKNVKQVELPSGLSLIDISHIINNEIIKRRIIEGNYWIHPDIENVGNNYVNAKKVMRVLCENLDKHNLVYRKDNINVYQGKIFFHVEWNLSKLN